MRFALLGDHPDGLDMARALAESGRHELATYSGPPTGGEYLRRWNLKPARVGDLEEVLADPRIDAVIVAGAPGDRSAQLRRALQSERHALCVHPLDQDPDSAYEAAMLQADARRLAFPILPLALHPGIERLAELARHTRTADEREGPARTQSGFLRLVEMESWSAERILLDAGLPAHEPGLPGWDVLRAIGGEVNEVTALASAGELPADEPIILAGSFQNGALFQVVLLPNQPESRWRMTVLTRAGRSELIFPDGWPGTARLSGIDEHGAVLNENWDTWNPWPRLVEAFETAVFTSDRGAARVSGWPSPPRGDLQAAITADPQHAPSVEPRAIGSVPLGWQDEIRCLELDDAARRSIARRRTTTLDYQEASEETGFKGTMTLVGCSMIWLCLVLLILAVWVPWLGWFIIPVLAVFLLLQMLRWVVPGTPPENRP